jgi:hypothetical protein
MNYEVKIGTRGEGRKFSLVSLLKRATSNAQDRK